MSFTTLMVLTVIEIVLLVGVLAIFLRLLTNRLSSVALSLSRVAWGVRAVEVEVGSIGPAVAQVNSALADLTNNLLPAVARKANALVES